MLDLRMAIHQPKSKHMNVHIEILTKDEVVWPEDLPKGTRPHRVHCSWFQVHQHCTRDILATW